MAVVLTDEFVRPCMPLWFQAAGIIVRREDIIKKNDATSPLGTPGFIRNAHDGLAPLF